jgi:hypothetical protein
MSIDQVIESVCTGGAVQGTFTDAGTRELAGACGIPSGVNYDSIKNAGALLGFVRVQMQAE